MKGRGAPDRAARDGLRLHFAVTLGKSARLVVQMRAGTKLMRRDLLGGASALLVAEPAAAFNARNGLRVERAGEATFDVPWSGRAAAAAFWCAAGDYAMRFLNVPPATRIYRYSRRLAPPRAASRGSL